MSLGPLSSSNVALNKRVVGSIHGVLVHRRRAKVLSLAVSDLIETDSAVLDVGSGDGLIASLVKLRRPDLHITAIDTSVRAADLRGWKRIDLLLRACALLPLESFRLIVIGDGPDKPRLQSKANTLGIASNTWFSGVKEHIGDYLSLVDIFVLPSMRLESFGNAAVEAMSQGIPTIIFNDGGGLLEHVADGETGYVVSSVEELSARLTVLTNDKSLRNRIGSRGRDFVRSRYTLQNMVSSYDVLYESALKRRSASP